MSPVIRFLESYARTRWFGRFTDRGRLLAWQREKVAAHLRRIHRSSPYYNSRISEQDAGRLEAWPVMDKAAMMASFDDLNTAGLRLAPLMAGALAAEASRDFPVDDSRFTAGLSSGTSGHRGIFVASREEQLEWAGTMLAKALPRGLLHPARIALFLRANNALYNRCRGRRIDFRYFDLLVPVAEQIAALEEFAPTVLAAPPGLLRQLAEHGARFRPERIFSIAEVLEPADAMAIEAAFQRPVHQIYQATEGFLGISCGHGNLHLNEDIFHFEMEALDDRGRVTPIVTDFRRRTQPILRYRLNDLLVLQPDPCPCGSPFLRLDRIEGRCDEVLSFLHSDGHTMVPVFPDFLRGAVLQAGPAIAEYRIVQTGPSALTVELRTTPSAAESAIESEVRHHLARLFACLHLAPPAVRFAAWQPAGPLEKRRRILRA